MTMLCEKCRVISFDDQLPGLHETTLDNGQVVLNSESAFLELNFDRWDTFPDLPDLQSSAQHGCGFCGLLKDALQEIFTDEFPMLSKYYGVEPRIHLNELKYMWDPEPYQDPPDNWDDESGRWEGIYFLEVVVGNADDTFKRNFGFDVVADEGRLDLLTEMTQVKPQSAEKYWIGQFVSNYLRIHRRPLSNSAHLLNSATSNIISWMEDCLNHESCARDTFIPTRLIELDSDGQSVPRLISTLEDDRFSDEKNAPNYLALSYCWGPPDASRPPLKTEISSLNRRLQGILPQEVPRTIADAFTVTTAVGIRFIWIDAL